jgi:hypothetical protein
MIDPKFWSLSCASPGNDTFATLERKPRFFTESCDFDHTPTENKKSLGFSIGNNGPVKLRSFCFDGTSPGMGRYGLAFDLRLKPFD